MKKHPRITSINDNRRGKMGRQSISGSDETGVSLYASDHTSKDLT